MTPSNRAASRTVRVMGPAVSWDEAIGMIPALLTSPTVGLTPTNPLTLEGDVIDPSVSVPMAAMQRFADTAAPEPELEPDGFRSSAYGFRVSPPRPDQPLTELEPRKLAHSLRFDFPRIMAPAARRRATTNESSGGCQPASARDPALVAMRSWVSKLSLTKTGTPCSRPRRCPARRSASA